MGSFPDVAGVFPLTPRALSTRSRYSDVPEIARFEATGSPIHVAVHHVSAAGAEERRYCATHSHPFAEVNILIGGTGELKYRLRIGREEKIVESPASIWIPAGTPHAANLHSGAGTFVVIYVSEPQTDPLA